MRTVLRPGDARRGRELFGHRELQPPHRRPRSRDSPAHPARLLPDGLAARHRRVPRHRAAAARPVRGRPVAQGDAGRARLPAAVGRRQPAAALRGVLPAGQPVHLPVGHAVAVRDRAVDPGGRADRAADRSGRPRGHRQADPGPDRRPDRADRRSGSRQGARVLVTTLTKKMAEDLTDYLAGDGRAGPVPALQRRHHPAHRDHPGPAPRRVRRPGRHQPACGRASTSPRSRWSPSSMPTRRASCAAGRRSSRRWAGRPATSTARSSCTPTTSPTPCSGPSRRPSAGGGSSRPTTPSTASTRRRSARRSPTSSRCCGPTTSRHPCRAGTAAAGAGTTWPATSPSCPATSWAALIRTLEEEMHQAATELRFEYAARLRDEISDLKRDRRGWRQVPSVRAPDQVRSARRTSVRS